MRAVLAAAFTSRLIPEIEPLPKDVWHPVLAQLSDEPTPEEAEEATVSILDSDSARAVRERLEELSAFADALSRLESAGIFALHDRHPRFPVKWRERLGASSPPLAFSAGNLELFNSRCIAVVGSRSASPDALEFARELGAMCASEGLTLVSGGARGVDESAMRSAWSEGGNSVGVLADSMLQRVGDPETNAALESGRVALVCPYSPNAPFTVGNAMGRNKLIYTLADASAVVSCAYGSGGTWAGAVEALKAGWVPVGVWEKGEEPRAMRALQEKGGLPLRAATDILSVGTRASESLFPEMR